MKIAVVFPKDSNAFFSEDSTSTFGGANVQLFLVAKALLKNKDVITYCLVSEYESLKKDQGVVATFKNSDSLLKKLWKFHRTLRTLKPEIIIQRGLTVFSCLLALYAWVFRFKFIFMYAHNYELKGRYQKNNKKCPLYFLLTRFTHLFIVQSRDQQQQLPDKHLKKIFVLKSVYPVKKFHKDPGEYILWVSRLEAWKQPEIFIELAKAFPKQKFMMIAPSVPGHETYADSIYTRVQEVKNITLKKMVPFHTIDRYFKTAIIFINTSIEEGFPNTFVQSAKNYTPVISLNVNPDNVLHDYDWGFCCGGDNEKLKEYISVLTQNRKTYKKMADNAFTYAQQNHDINENITRLMEHLHKIQAPVK